MESVFLHELHLLLLFSNVLSALTIQISLAV